MLERISAHAIDQYQDRVDKKTSRSAARVVLFNLYRKGHNATSYEIKEIRQEEPDGETTLRLCDTCYGLIVMPIKRGVMMTCWALESWQVRGR